MTFNETYRQFGCAFHPSRLGLIAFAPDYASVLNWMPARLIEQMNRLALAELKATGFKLFSDKKADKKAEKNERTSHPLICQIAIRSYFL
jgi:hypothetical protein